MKNLVLSLFLIFSFAVQGFGSDIELSIQKGDKCFKKIFNDSSNKCSEDLGLSCIKGNDCSDCLAYIYMNLIFKFSDSNKDNEFLEVIGKIIEYKYDTCPNLMRDTERISDGIVNSIKRKNKR